MPYLFTCPYCNSQTEVEDQYSGQSGECFSCNSPIQLPDFDQIQAQADTTAAKQVSQKTIFRFAIAGMLLIVLVAGTAAVIGELQRPNLRRPLSGTNVQPQLSQR